MKVQTNQGECELTAEMVCRGMVFQDPKIGPYALVGYDHYAQAWITETKGTRTDAEVAIAHVFLGCDPAIASRADCERFGVYGDAGAHGFARLRGGGAVDLRREAPPAGSVVVLSNGQRVTLRYKTEACFGGGQRFIGLRADVARPKDVERLCCGAPRESRTSEGALGLSRLTVDFGPRCTLAIGPHDQHEDLATGVRWKAEHCSCPKGDNGNSATCRIHGVNESATRREIKESRPATKIGWYSAQMAEVSGTSVYRTPDDRTVEVTGITDGEEHSIAWPDLRRIGPVTEFVKRGLKASEAAWTHLQDAIPMTLSTASGFRFDGSGDLRSRLSGPLCGRCAKPVDSGPFGPMMLVLPDGEQKVSAPICQVCLAHVNKDIGAWRIRGGSIEETSPEDVARYGGFPEPTAEQWERLRAAFPAHFSAGRSVGDPHPISGSLADERRLHDCPRCASGPRRTYCSVACGDAEQAARRAADRRQREAPLVALVNACPKGLDPVGWRAGVLAYAEMFRSDADFHWFRKSDMPHVLAVIRDGEKSTGMNIRVFVDAYQRALAPRAKVAPERKGMTWKTRGPKLPVDHGED